MLADEAIVFADKTSMSGNYFLRSGTTDQKALSEKGTSSSSTSGTSKVVQSKKTISSSSESSVDVLSHSLPFFGYSTNLTPKYNKKMSSKAEPSAGGHLLDGSANRQISSSQEAIFDAQNMLGNEVVEVVDDMNLDMDIG